MDLTWEICEAFMQLGELPPLHFCRPPAMAGRGKSTRDKWIIEGCKRQLKAAAENYAYAYENLEKVVLS